MSTTHFGSETLGWVYFETRTLIWQCVCGIFDEKILLDRMVISCTNGATIRFLLLTSFLNVMSESFYKHSK